MRNVFGRLLVAGLLAAFSVKTARAVDCTYQPPVPAGIVHVTRPALCFPIAPQGQVKVVKVEMALNQTPVEAAYSDTKKAVLYRPAQPLTPGDYVVQCRITFDDHSTFPQQWRFTVAPDAVTDLPAPSAAQTALFHTVNALRQGIGRPPFTLDQALCAAAQAHARYARVNSSGNFHEEQIGRPGATGALPQDRADNFGFTDPLREVGSTDTFALDAGQVKRLFDAPYHRPPFLEPDGGALGTGSEGGLHQYLAVVLEISRSAAEATVVSPFPGQRSVPTAWTDTETPDPLRLHISHPAQVGYPIVFAHFPPSASRLTQAEPITVTDMTLTTGGREEVPAFWNTPATDPLLTDSAILIPQSPLMPGTTYHVTVKAATASGRDISQEWDFTTEGAAAPPERQAGERQAGEIEVRKVSGALQVRFPRTVTRLHCFFDGSRAVQKSSPPVHADSDGNFLARYPLPAGAHSYRLEVTQDGKTRVVRGRV